jgi:Protein of unknown function (DUF2975)
MEKQQRKDRLVSRLYYMSLGLLALFALNTLLTISLDIFQTKPFENFTSMPNHVTGYTMAANIRVNTFDTLINYRRGRVGSNGFESGSITLKNGVDQWSDKKKIGSILTSTACEKAIIRQTKDVHSDSEFNVNPGNVELAPVTAKGYVLIKPKDIRLTLLLALRNYATTACILFILFQLTRLFKRLKNNFSFNSYLSRTIWLIGNCLLAYQILLFITGMIVTSFIENITYTEKIAGLPGSKQVISMNISYDVSLITLFTGLALVVFSKLLNYGYELQQENDLTI